MKLTGYFWSSLLALPLHVSAKKGNYCGHFLCRSIVSHRENLVQGEVKVQE